MISCNDKSCRPHKSGVNSILCFIFLFFFMAGNCFGSEDEVFQKFSPMDKFFDAQVLGEHIWMVGYKGRVFHSSNLGATWDFQESGTKEPLFSVSFSNAKMGLAVGEFGTIIRTTDGGNSWSLVERFTKETLRSVHFIDAQHAYVVGSFSSIFSTTNGGLTWDDHSLKQDGEPLDAILDGVFFIDKEDGWAVGEFGTIVHTADGGISWEKQQSGLETEVYLTNLFFVSKMEGWLVGQDGTILHTIDGGNVWLPLKSGVNDLLLDIFVGKNRIGYAVGIRGAVSVSTDHGKSWDVYEGAQDFPHWWLSAVSFDGEIGVIAGGKATVLVTNNMGEKWRLLNVFSTRQ